MKLTERQADALMAELGEFAIESNFPDTGLSAEFVTLKGETVFKFHIEYSYGAKWCDRTLYVHFTPGEEEAYGKGTLDVQALHKRFQEALDHYWDEDIGEHIIEDQKDKLWEEGSSREFHSGG